MALSLLEEITQKLGVMSPAVKKALIKEIPDSIWKMKWDPTPGPQTQAYFCKADILLYGGQGGGGKSDLGLGLAFTAHQRSLIMRRKYANLSALTERAININKSRDGFNGSPPPLLRTNDDRYIQFAGNQHAGDEQDWQGHPFDLKYFDEATQFLESQIRFHLGWLRSTTPGQRVRAVLGSNPPVDSDGDWIIGMFRPWLDITHAKPAKHGELRWFVTDPDGKDLEVAGPELVEIDGKPLTPLSRTFIPARLSDNPYLFDDGKYQAQLDGLPEPLRSAVRDGNFMAGRRDAEWQLIPTAWIEAAQARWTEKPTNGLAMTAQAIDCAGGGTDSAVLASRHGGWYANLEAWQGPETADPYAVVGKIVQHRRDACPVVVDMGGGYGGGVAAACKQQGIAVAQFNGASASVAKARDGKLGFINKRAEAWWRFREELDPSQKGGSVIALPPDPELRSDLASPRWELTTRGIKIESKDDIKKRLGRSPDKGDAVTMCLSVGTAAAAAAMRRSHVFPGSNRRLPEVTLGHAHMKKGR